MEPIPADLKFIDHEFHFTYDTTRVEGFTYEPIYNRVLLREYNRRIVTFINCGALAILLSGLELEPVPDENLDILDEFYEKHGWNAPTLIRNFADEEVVEHYIARSLRDVEGAVSVPKDW